jgi:hypothetical protein
MTSKVPKGSYCPVFRRRTDAAREQNGDSSALGVAAAHARPTVSPIVAIVPLKPLTGGPKERFLAELLADGAATGARENASAVARRRNLATPGRATTLITPRPE